MGAGALKIGATATRGATATANAVRLGKAGENTAILVKNTERIASATKTAAYRIPDSMTPKIVNEVKNVAELSYTSQIRDLAAFAGSTGRTMVLTIRRNTTLSGPLQAAVDAGEIVLNRIL